MRTTVTLADDVVAAVERVQREEGVGPSEAVNRLVRRALAQQPWPARYEHPAADLGLRVDVTDIGAVLDLLDDA